MGFNVLYNPCVKNAKIKISFQLDHGVTIFTMKPMHFSDVEQLECVDYDGFLYKRQIDESSKLIELMKSLHAIDFATIMNSKEPSAEWGYSKVVISRSDYGYSFDITILNSEISTNPEVKRIHNLLLELFAHFEMEGWYDYAIWRNNK